MNKKFAFLLMLVGCWVVTGATMAAVVVKKAAPVATKTATKTDSAAGMLGAVVNIAMQAKSLQAQQKELSEACIPTSSDISFVNDMIKEWAKSGRMSNTEALSQLNATKCTSSYSTEMEMIASTGIDEVCVEVFESSSDKGQIWEGYPKASVASYCADGSTSCSKNKKTVSNIYDVFNLVDFDPNTDYRKSELQRAQKLTEKIENCSNAKLSKKKKELWAGFLKDSLSNTGKNYNTGSILESVQQFGGGGGNGIMGGLSNIGGVATQLFNK